MCDGVLKDKRVLLSTQPIVNTGDAKRVKSFLVSCNLCVRTCV